MTTRVREWRIVASAEDSNTFTQSVGSLPYLNQTSPMNGQVVIDVGSPMVSPLVKASQLLEVGRDLLSKDISC